MTPLPELSTRRTDPDLFFPVLAIVEAGTKPAKLTPRFKPREVRGCNHPTSCRTAINVFLSATPPFTIESDVVPRPPARAVLFPPFDKTWIEWRTQHYRVGAYVTPHRHQLPGGMVGHLGQKKTISFFRPARHRNARSHRYFRRTRRVCQPSLDPSDLPPAGRLHPSLRCPGLPQPTARDAGGSQAPPPVPGTGGATDRRTHRPDRRGNHTVTYSPHPGPPEGIAAAQRSGDTSAGTGPARKSGSGRTREATPPTAPPSAPTASNLSRLRTPRTSKSATDGWPSDATPRRGW